MRKYKDINKLFVKVKVFTDRARMYLGYINFFLLNFVFLQSAEIEWLQSENSSFQFLFYSMIGLIGFGLILFIGYLDHILGIRKEEMQNIADNNPFAIKVLEDLESIKSEIKNIAGKQQRSKQN